MLPDVLAEQMKIVFCGTSSETRSGEGGYYASPGNKFWMILHKAGLTPVLIEPCNYKSLATYRLGLSDLTKNTRHSDEARHCPEFDCQSLTEKIIRFSPQILCFNGKKAAKAYFSNRNIDYGWQKESIGATKVFVAPSTSGSASRYWDEKWWFILADSFGAKVTKIDKTNYYQPDAAWHGLKLSDASSGPGVNPTESDFIDAIDDVGLHYSIPLHIRNMFEIARALFVYGYLYYPFCTLAIEQSLKCLEAIVSLKYDKLGGPQFNNKGMHPPLAEKINYLYRKRVISKSQKEILHDCRQLRNMSFHPRYQQVLGHYDGALRTLASLMNEVWQGTK